MVIRSFRVTYHLNVEEAPSTGKHDVIGRPYRLRPPSCPVHRSIAGCIDITTDLELHETWYLTWLRVLITTLTGDSAGAAEGALCHHRDGENERAAPDY